ncbi:MAG TPA: IS5 family transposase [Lacipirellulaceae bacterium]|nr:IS5 family transposase [Lacipirellulaceae bacterium]
MPRHTLTDDEWDCIKDLFPAPAKTGRPRSDPRRMVNGILWVLRTGAPWRDLPKEHGAWTTVWDHFDRWNHDGTLSKILEVLRASFIDAGEIDNDLWCLDGTIVRAARCANGGGKKTIRRSLQTTH